MLAAFSMGSPERDPPVDVIPASSAPDKTKDAWAPLSSTDTQMGTLAFCVSGRFTNSIRHMALDAVN